MVSKMIIKSRVFPFLQVLGFVSGIPLLIREENELISSNYVKAADDTKIVEVAGPKIVDFDIIGPMPKIGRSGIIDENARWPSTTIIYEMDTNIPSPFRATFMKAMNHITGRTCIVFKERMTENDHVFITYGMECSSTIGKRGGRQLLTLGPQCGDFQTHVHLLVHVIGFGHENNRSDRDDYITVNYANIDPINHSNFDRYPEQAYRPFSAPYDYSSITHFGTKVQSANGLDTITPKQVGALIGEAQSLSELDIKKINNMYCEGSLGILIRNVHDGNYLDVKGGVAGEGKDVVLTKLSDQDGQKWTANWFGLLNGTRGSTIASWAQDGGRLKVLDQDESAGLVMTWGYASGYRNQFWVMEEVPLVTTEQKRYQIKNLGSSRCLSAPLVRCTGLNFFEYFFKRFIYNNCKGGQARVVSCNSENSRQLWNIEFANK